MTDKLTGFFTIFQTGIFAVIFPIVSAVVLGVLIFLLRKPIVKSVSRLVVRLTSRFSNSEAVVDAFERPVITFLGMLAAYVAALIICRSFFPSVVSFLTRIIKICLICCIAWGAVNTVEPVAHAIGSKKGNYSATIIGFVSKILKVVLALIAFVIIVDEAGYNINGLVTGLGLGGLTFALAAQDTASNLFGGLIIITDKPFENGDWIKTPNIEGVVSGISLRSTRLRTFLDTEIIVPNSTLASAAITNCSRMNKRKVDMVIGLTYSTSRELLEKVIENVREIIKSNPRVEPETVLVAFDNFGASSLDIKVAFFIRDTAFADYMGVKEGINLQIMDAVQELGADFAFPTRTLYLENASPALIQK